jgi:hypothetical protein
MDETSRAMTTLMIDGELERLAKQVAAENGKTLQEFVSDVLRKAVGSRTIVRKERNGIPVVEMCPSTTIDPAHVRQAIEEEGF